MEGGDYHAGFCGVKQFCNDRFVRVIEKNTAIKRGAQSEEIANVIAFAASHEATYI
jgi:hypothetical protein